MSYVQDMERWCAKKPVTQRIREADAHVMAGLIQVSGVQNTGGRAVSRAASSQGCRTARCASCSTIDMAVHVWRGSGLQCAALALPQVQDAVLASGRSDPPHVVARLNRFGSTETAKR